MQQGSYISTQCRDTTEFSKHKLKSDEQKDSRHVFCVEMSPCFCLFGAKLNAGISVEKMRKVMQAIIRGKGESQHLWRCWDAAIYLEQMTCISQGTTNTRVYISILARRMTYVIKGNSSQGACAYFNRTTHSTWLQQHVCCMRLPAVFFWKCMAHHEEESQNKVNHPLLSNWNLVLNTGRHSVVLQILTAH